MNRPEPIPTITASTNTLRRNTTLPKTFSAGNEVLFQSANGTSTKPARVVSELDERDEKLDRQHEAQHHDQPGEEQHQDGIMVQEHLGNPIMSSSWRKIGPPASRPVFANRRAARSSPS